MDIARHLIALVAETDGGLRVRRGASVQPRGRACTAARRACRVRARARAALRCFNFNAAFLSARLLCDLVAAGRRPAGRPSDERPPARPWAGWIWQQANGRRGQRPRPAPLAAAIATNQRWPVRRQLCMACGVQRARGDSRGVRAARTAGGTQAAESGRCTLHAARCTLHPESPTRASGRSVAGCPIK